MLHVYTSRANVYRLQSRFRSCPTAIRMLVVGVALALLPSGAGAQWLPFEGRRVIEAEADGGVQDLNIYDDYFGYLLDDDPWSAGFSNGFLNSAAAMQESDDGDTSGDLIMWGQAEAHNFAGAESYFRTNFQVNDEWDGEVYFNLEISGLVGNSACLVIVELLDTTDGVTELAKWEWNINPANVELEDGYGYWPDQTENVSLEPDRDYQFSIGVIILSVQHPGGSGGLGLINGGLR